MKRAALIFFSAVLFFQPRNLYAGAEEAKLQTLQPEFRSRVVEMLDLARASWPDKKIVIAEAYRSQARQDRLYKKGAATTTVKKSKHTEGLAVDVYFVDARGAIIPYGKAPYDELGIIGESVGLCWGGRWKTPFDPGHFQLGYTGEYYKGKGAEAIGATA